MTGRPRLGVLGGSVFLAEALGAPVPDSAPLPSATVQRVETSYGVVTVRVAEDWVFIQRHGESEYRPPHRIPHRAHVAALEGLGVTAVAGFASTGALDPGLAPGDVVVPDDYISWHPPPTFAEDEYLHIVPELSGSIRDLLVSAARAAAKVAPEGSARTAATAPPDGSPHASSAADPPGRAPVVRDGGVYVEMRGPRFETKAEVRLLARHADVVGMTAASEATLCQERDLPYAMLCIVDNFAHGVGGTTLTLEAYRAQLGRNARLARTIFTELLRLWRTS